MRKLIHWSNAFIQMSLNECAMWTHSYVVERVWFICRWMIHMFASICQRQIRTPTLTHSYVVEWVWFNMSLNDPYVCFFMSTTNTHTYIDSFVCRWMIHMFASICERQIRTPTLTHSYVVKWLCDIDLFICRWMIHMSASICQRQIHTPTLTPWIECTN